MERPHGELRAGLADRLGGDDADGLAVLGFPPCGETAAVADGADAALDLARER